MSQPPSIRTLLASAKQREQRAKTGRRKGGGASTAKQTARRDGEGQSLGSGASHGRSSKQKDLRYRKAVAEAAPELERITEAASKGAQAVVEACLDFDEGGKEDESLVTDAVETYGSLVMSEVQTRLKTLQNLWVSQKVAKKKAIDDRVLSLMAEIRDGREREREDAERSRSELKATKSQQVQEDLESRRVELKKGVRAEIAIQFADLGGFPLLRGEAKSELEQRRDDREAGLAALRVELEKKLDNQQRQEKAEFKERNAKLVDFRDNHGDDQVRRMLKLNSQIAIEKARIAELKRKLEEQRVQNAEKQRVWADTCGQRVAAARENLRLDTIRAEEWRAKQGKGLEVMKGEAVAAKEAGFLLQQLQDSSSRAMSTLSEGTAPRTRSRDVSTREEKHDVNSSSAGNGTGRDADGGSHVGREKSNDEVVDNSGGSGLTEEGLKAHFEARERRMRGEPELAPADASPDADSSVVAAGALLGVSEETESDMMNVSLREAAIDDSRPDTHTDTAGGSEKRRAGIDRRQGTHGVEDFTPDTLASATGSGKSHNTGELADSTAAVSATHAARSAIANGDAVAASSGKGHNTGELGDRTAVVGATNAARSAIASGDAVSASGLSAEVLERQIAALLAAGPPPSTPEEALRLLAAAGWEDNTGAAMQLALLEKSKRIESERQRQDLADRWAAHSGRESMPLDRDLSSGVGGDGRSEGYPFSPVSDISGSNLDSSGRRRSRRRKGRNRDSLINRTVSGREYGEGVELIPVVRVESSPELCSRRGDPSPPPFSPQPSVDGSIRGHRRGATMGGLRRTTSLMPVPHLTPSPNRSGRAGSVPGDVGGAGAGTRAPAVVYDPFMTDGDHTALGRLLLNLGGASSIDPRWAPPGGGGRMRRRGKMRGESRLGMAPPRGDGAWTDMAPSPGAKAIAAARMMTL